MQRPSRRLSDAELLALRPAVRAALQAEGVGDQDLRDCEQETLLRLLQARGRLEPTTAAAYAVVTARNVIRSLRRAEAVAVRNRRRLPSPEVDAPDPVAVVLSQEEHAATARAVAALPEPMRQTLLAAASDHGRPAASAERSRAFRARAQARVEYVLAYRRATLPSPHCRSVLLAISGRDHRRQASLDAGRHLLDCPVCSSLASPLLERRRGLAAFLPLPVALALVRWPHRRRAVAAVSTAAGIAVLVAGVVAAGAYGGGDGKGSASAVGATSSVPVAPAASQTPGTSALPSMGATGLAGSSPPPSAPTVTGHTVVGTVLFATGSWSLDGTGRRVIARAAQVISHDGRRSVLVTGHTDSAAGVGSNAQLSQRRAAVVAAALRRLLGPSYQVAVAATASADPAATNGTASGRAQNRRAVIGLG